MGSLTVYSHPKIGMQVIHCSGSPFEIGHQHGRAAHAEILNGLLFYGQYFQEKSKLDWNSVKEAARKFLPLLRAKCPHLVEEMQGVADGVGVSSVSFEDILVMNVRTEIAMGLMNDGCTALYWKRDQAALLAQNWDWEYRQQRNLVALHITQPGKPSISMITEGGIIGKIGINSAGVGVCLNAIRAKGIDFSRLPTHLALRTALESRSRLEAVSSLEAVGVGTSCHILVGDVTGGTGLEFSHADLKRLELQDGKLCHSNHFVEPHSTAEGLPIKESVFLDDSKFRLSRMGELLEIAEQKGMPPTVETVEEQLNDEENYPTAINRACRSGNEVATLFSIVMDLTTKTARVRIGRPTESTETVVLHPVEKAE